MAQRPKRALAGIVLVVINVQMYMKIVINYLQLISYYIHVYIKAIININRSKPEHIYQTSLITLTIMIMWISRTFALILISVFVI